jgi:metallo-beta-lactamase family protein
LQAYRRLKPYWDAEARSKIKAKRHPLNFEQLLTIDDHKTHLQTVDYLAKTARPAIVIAASGMYTGGRVVNYLKALVGWVSGFIAYHLSINPTHIR